MRRLAVLVLSFSATAAFAADPILVAGKEWKLLGEGYQLTADSAVAPDGAVYFTDHQKNRIMRVDADGRIAVWKADSGGSHGIAEGPGDRLYAGRHDRKQIVAFDRDGKESVVAEGMQTHHLTVTKSGVIYFAEAPKRTIWFVDAASGTARPGTTAVTWPHGLQLSSDHSRLFVTDTHTDFVWVFDLQRDATLANGRRFCQLATRNHATECDAGGMAVDTDGFLCVATDVGVQVFDSAGRRSAILDVPGEGASDVYFAGPALTWLYVTDGSRIYRHPANRRGAR